jgi:hypothetical protein
MHNQPGHLFAVAVIAGCNTGAALLLLHCCFSRCSDCALLQFLCFAPRFMMLSVALLLLLF